MAKTKRNKRHEKVLRGLLKELGYFNCKGNLADFHGRFNNLLQSNICSKRYLDNVMRIRIIFSLSVMQFQTFLELSYNL